MDNEEKIQEMGKKRNRKEFLLFGISAVVVISLVIWAIQVLPVANRYKREYMDAKTFVSNWNARSEEDDALTGGLKISDSSGDHEYQLENGATLRYSVNTYWWVKYMATSVILEFPEEEPGNIYGLSRMLLETIDEVADVDAVFGRAQDAVDRNSLSAIERFSVGMESETQEAYAMFVTTQTVESESIVSDKNASIGNALNIVRGEAGKYYGITYDNFVDKLGTVLTYAAGSESMTDVSGIVSACKNIGKKTESIEGYSADVFSRELVFYVSETYGFPIEMFYMHVYTTRDSDKIVRVEVKKNNMSDYSKADRDAFLDRFTVLANGVTELLSGKKIADYGTKYEYKTEGTTHFFRYNESEVVFKQQESMLGDQRVLLIMPASEESEGSIGLDSSVADNTKQTPAWSLTQEELDEKFRSAIYEQETEYGPMVGTYEELFSNYMEWYDVNFFKPGDERLEDYSGVGLYDYTFWDLSWGLDGFVQEYGVSEEYMYVAIVFGDAYDSALYPEESGRTYYRDAMKVLMLFDEKGEVIETIVLSQAGLLKSNVEDVAYYLYRLKAEE